MTIAIGTLTAGGIVLSADSRQTYRNNAGIARIGSDTAIKLFQLTEKVGTAVAGKAFIRDSRGIPKNVGYFVEAFKKTIQPDWTVKAIAEDLNQYLGDLFIDKELQELRLQVAEMVGRQGGVDLVFAPQERNTNAYSFRTADGTVKQDFCFVDTVQLIVAGLDGEVGHAYSVLVPAGIQSESDTEQCGAMWIGQGDVISRMLLGYDPAGGTLDFVAEAMKRDPAGTNDQLAKLRYVVNWNTMTLQDAIDFNVLITRTTESIQRFTDGTILNPGGITGVGGDIAVAVIQPDGGFNWVTKTRLTVGGVKLDE